MAMKRMERRPVMPAAQGPLARARHAVVPLLSLSVLGSAACAARGAPVEAPVDLTIAPIVADAGPRLPVSSTFDKECTAQMRAARIDKSSPGCVLDEQISQSTGYLHYPCTGDGPVEAQFGAQRYTGALLDGEVELTLDTELDWEGDHCKWGTRALIKGRLLANGRLTGQRLTWTYRDTIISGTNCSGACTARSSFQVIPSLRPGPSEPNEDDDDSD